MSQAGGSAVEVLTSVRTLQELESVIERGQQTFIEVGEALAEIQERLLYQVYGYATFEDYCRDRWNWSRATAYKYIQAAGVARTIAVHTYEQPPIALSQASQLAALPVEQQREIAERVDFSNTTVRELRAIVQEAQGLRNGIAKCDICDNLYDAETFPTYCPYCRKKSLGVVGWVPREVLDNPTFSTAPIGELTQEAQLRPHVSFNAGNNQWYTPPEYIVAARQVLGVIDLDPASSDIANRCVRATHYYTAESDGLAYSWTGRVWMNPPYAAELIGKFADKLIQHFAAGEVTKAIVLVNNATETNWFQGLLGQSSAVCFPRQRVRFLDPAGNPGAPLQGQAVLYLGDSASDFAREFAVFGKVLFG